MNMSQNPVFPAKLLLFGEYSIVIGGQGLTVPYAAYGGSLEMARTNILNRNEEIRRSNDNLRQFAGYLTQLQDSGALLCRLHLEKLQTNISQGLYFNSNIPAGYGLGSSGALCAAIYFHYAADAIPATAENATSSQAITQLRSIFAQFEAFFHGASSGIDPLVCYMRQPLHILGDNNVQLAQLPATMPRDIHFFFLETGKPRPSNSGLVPLFLEKFKDPEFADICRLYLTKYNNNCIHAFLHSDAAALWENMRRLSQFQLVHFEPMIPLHLMQIWRRGLNRRHFYLKLCGAGGGGYMLGLCKNMPETASGLDGSNVQEIEF